MIFCLVLVSAGCLRAQDKLNLKWGKVDAADFALPNSAVIDSNTDAVIIADVGNTSFVGNRKGWFSYVFKRKTRIKILNKKGFDAATVMVNLYNDEESQEKLEDVSGTTYNLESGRITETRLNKNEIFESKLNIHWKEKKFSMPAVKEGSIIEFSYTVNSDFDFNIPAWNFQNVEFPCLWSEYEVKIPTTLVYVFVKQGYHDFTIHQSSIGHQTFHVTTAEDKNSLTSTAQDYSVAANTNNHRWVIKDLPALNILRIDPYISCPKNYIDRIEFQLHQTYDGSETHDVMNTWAKATEDLMKSEFFGQPIRQDNDWLNKDLLEITAGAETPLDQARKIYYYVASHFTCTSHYQTEIQTSLPAVFKKHAGSVGEVNLLLIAMLRQKGIDADPVLLSTREYGINYVNYPVLDRLNYLICRTKINSQIYYLDASVPLLGFGFLPENCYNGHARIICEKDSGSVFFFADSLKQSKNTSVIIINDEKGYPSGEMRSTLGYYDSHDVREQLKKEDEKDFFKAIQTSYGTDLVVGKSGIDSLDRLEDPVQVHYEFDFANWKDQDIIYFNPLMSESIRENPFKSAERKYLVEMPYAFDNNYTFSMEVPKGFRVDEIPKSTRVAMNGSDGLFEYLVQNSGTDIQLRCHLRLNRATYSPAEYNMLREFYANVVKKESEQIVFKKIK
jgi:hypothetical protein